MHIFLVSLKTKGCPKKNGYNFCHLSPVIKSRTSFQNYMKRALQLAQKLHEFIKKG